MRPEWEFEVGGGTAADGAWPGSSHSIIAHDPCLADVPGNGTVDPAEPDQPALLRPCPRERLASVRRSGPATNRSAERKIPNKISRKTHLHDAIVGFYPSTMRHVHCLCGRMCRWCPLSYPTGPLCSRWPV